MNPTAALIRPFVTWRKTPSTEARLLQFSECLLELFVPSNCEAKVKLSQNEQGVELMASEESGCIPLAHPPSCPFLQLSQSERQSLANHHLSVASCLLALSADNKVLLTRRNANLRAYPGVWVPPGGHTDPGESLEESACREFVEETGLKLSQSASKKAKLLGLWEGTYPTLRSLGLPKRHHLVAYYCLKLEQNSADLDQFALAPAEVDFVAWLPQSAISHIIDPSKDANSFDIAGFKLANDTDGSVVKVTDFSISNFTGEIGSDGTDIDRVSSGTKFALRQLFHQKQF